MVKDTLAILGAYAAKRWTLARLRTREDVAARQRKLLAPHLDSIAHTIPFYRGYAGRPLADWPIMDKSAVLTHFSALNAHGVTGAQAWRIAEEGLAQANGSGRQGCLTIGTSSGTSGNRGLFLISDRERRLWLGSILARTLPDFPFRRHRIAVMLATANNLYETTRQSRRLSFRFFDLRQGLDSHRARMETFAPDVLVAPPKVLRLLAERDFKLKPTHVFAGGEVLDPLDAAPFAARYGVAPRSIYQASEGFLGVACRHGAIHLNEDDMLIEREPVPGYPDRFIPVITDLRRTAQAMIRYRLNDILVPSASPCPCGSPLLPIARVEGRCDDVIALQAREGPVTLMPDALRVTILDAERLLHDFRLDQTGADSLRLTLPTDAPEGCETKVRAALTGLLERHGAAQGITIETRRGIEEPVAGKLRRIRGLETACP